MFSAAIQPPLVSLFSSTGSDPLTLFSSHTDHLLPSDSCICFLKDSTSLPHPRPPVTLISLAEEREPDKPDYKLDQTVLHVQSPTLRSTYIRCPPLGWATPGRDMRSKRGDLGLEHPWMHVQVRNLNREWSFEVGIVDKLGREGVVRCSTFQKEPQLQLNRHPLLHLPLAFPSPSSRPLSAWSTIMLHFPSLLPHFSSTSLIRDSGGDEDADQQGVSEELDVARQVGVPVGSYSHVSYVKIYATCRLRRIYFSEDGPKQETPWEFQLYAAD